MALQYFREEAYDFKFLWGVTKTLDSKIPGSIAHDKLLGLPETSTRIEQLYIGLSSTFHAFTDMEHEAHEYEQWISFFYTYTSKEILYI